MVDRGVCRSNNTVPSTDGLLTVQGNNKVAKKSKQTQETPFDRAPLRRLAAVTVHGKKKFRGKI